MIRFEVRVFARLFPLSDVCEVYNHDQGFDDDMECAENLHITFAFN